MKYRPLFQSLIASIFLVLIVSLFLFASPATPAYASNIGKAGLKHMQGSLPKAEKLAHPDSSGSTQVSGNDTSESMDSPNAASATNNEIEQFTTDSWTTGEFTTSTDTHPMFQIELTGTVEVIASDSWTIDGTIYLVDGQTKIEDMIQVGDQVEFYAYTTLNGSMALAKVELYSDNAQYNDDSENKYEDEPSEDGGMYSSEDDDHQDSFGSSGTYQYSDDDHEDHHDGSYDDDHEDDHGQYNGSSGHHNQDHDDEHEGHDD